MQIGGGGGGGARGKNIMQKGGARQKKFKNHWNKKHMLTCQGGTGCYRAVNYQPGS